MLKKLKGQIDRGVFRKYFVGEFIKNKEDRESFEIYYQNRIACLMMAGVLGLHISANERYGITATNPTTGESCKLMHQCEPPFKNGNEGELFASDMDSLLEFEKFIIRQTQERIGETREMEYLEESESVLFNYIRTHSASSDFLQERYHKLMVRAGEEIYYTRPETQSLEADILLSSAYAGVNWLNCRIKNNPDIEISINEIVLSLKRRLSRQMKYPLEMRNFERSISLGYEKDRSDNTYWDYIKIAKNWEPQEEM